MVIGVIPTVTAIGIPAALREFDRAHPAVAIALRGGGSDDLVAGIGAGEVDVAVLGLPETVSPQRVRAHELARDRLVAVCSVGHRLAGRKTPALADLDGKMCADFPAGTPGRAQSDLAFGAAGLDREVAFEAMAPRKE